MIHSKVVVRSICRTIVALKSSHLFVFTRDRTSAGIPRRPRTALRGPRCRRCARSAVVIRLDVAARASPVRDRIFCKQARAKGQLISLAPSCFSPRARLLLLATTAEPTAVPRDSARFRTNPLSNGNDFSSSLFLFLPFLTRQARRASRLGATGSPVRYDAELNPPGIITGRIIVARSYATPYQLSQFASPPTRRLTPI